ncbi:MAG TPA: response regulator transcription factor [Microvirga sp.]|jgi:DNA-binding NarL/FixJ family response regulator|nr:response regulator transcription factor [Microvirga sp.]
MISVLVVDDHRIFRSGIKRLLSDEPDIRVTDEAANGTEALAKIRQRPFDVVMLDINMTGRSGLEAIACLRGEAPATPILIVSMYPEEQYAAVALKAGARGYVSKDADPEDLVAAIREVCRGRIYVSPHFGASMLLREKSGARGPPHFDLSAREQQIMTEIVKGRSLTRIGEQMFLSVKTVSTYRRRILEKLGLRSNAELVRYALRHRVID